MNKGYDMTLKEAWISIIFLEKMIVAKKQQIKNEPNESMWIDELTQLMGAKELIEMDLEFFEN